jgi:hypothetical protein
MEEKSIAAIELMKGRICYEASSGSPMGLSDASSEGRLRARHAPAGFFYRRGRGDIFAS